MPWWAIVAAMVKSSSPGNTGAASNFLSAVTIALPFVTDCVKMIRIIMNTAKDINRAVAARA